MDGYYSKPRTIQSLAPDSHKRKRKAQTEKIQSSSSKLSNCAINNLPDSLLIDILIRLPSAASATRCKSVCKQWLSLISTHCFVHSFSHQHNSTGKTRPFALTVNYGLDEPDYRYREELLLTSEELLFNCQRFKLTYLPCFNDGICILASFNDLLLCCASEKDHSVYYICNPFTMQWVALPPTPTKYMHERKIQVGFICDQYAYRNDQVKYRYAVMRIHVLKGSLAVEIFSSETGNWREFNVLSPQEVRWIQNDISAVAYNGMLHWLTVDGSIIAYNPYNIEQCRCIDCPKVTKPENIPGIVWNRLGVCCGFLRILQVLSLPFGHSQNLTVWELKDYDTGEWRLIYKVNLKEMISNSTWVLKYIKGNKKLLLSGRYIFDVDGSLILRVAALAFHPNNGDIVYLAFANHLVSCNMLRRELKVVSKIPLGSDFFDSNLFPLVHQWWPTPVPRIPHNVLS